MNGRELMKALEEADGVEESAIGAITGMLDFYISRTFDFGLPSDKILEVKTILKKLNDDSIRHKRILEETRLLIGGGQDDY